MSAGPTETRGVLAGLTPVKTKIKPSHLKSERLIKPQKDHPLVLNQHLWVGRINEPGNAEDFGLHPEDTGDLEVLQAREATWSDLHFGKVSLSWGETGLQGAGEPVGAGGVVQGVGGPGWRRKDWVM